MASGFAIVKQVISGDTLVVMGTQTNGPPPEKQLTLSSILAPRLGNRRAGVKDEPFAWESRECLRKLVIGKKVWFRVDYSVANIGRDFGTIKLGDAEKGQNVASLLVSNGWAKVKVNLPSNAERSPDHDDLVQLFEIAQSQGKGMFTKDEAAKENAVRELEDIEDATQFAKDNKNEKLAAVVEYVRDGSSLRVTFPDTQKSALILLSGIQAPSFKRGENPGDPETPQPFARESKHFMETRALNRDVEVIVEGADKFNNLIGSVFVNNVNVAAEVLRAGLAKVQTWSLMYSSSHVELQQAEDQAKAARHRLWKTYVPPTAKQVGGLVGKEFAAKVIEVVSGDTLVVQDFDSKAEYRITLASIRAPKAAVRRGDTGEVIGEDQPYWHEAKEYLRKKLVGKKVTVQVDYTRKVEIRNADKQEERVIVCANVLKDGVNMAEKLVESGYATVVKHRQDEDRSRHYTALQLAEHKAMEEKKGLHDPTDAPQYRVNDMSGNNNAAKAKSYLPFLLKAGRVEGLVEAVANGGRYRVFLPKEHALIAFALTGVRCPAPERKDQPAEPFGNEALQFARERVLQRNVEIEVEAVDRMGTFIGTLHLGKENMGEILLDSGLGYLHSSFNAERVKYGEVLQRAQATAKANKIGYWKDYVEPVVVEEEEATDRNEYMDCTATELLNGSNLFLQNAATKQELSWLEEHLRSLSLNERPHAPAAPPRGQQCCAKFSDDQWYRAVVQDVSADGHKCKVHFIDYGNTDVVPTMDLRPPIANVSIAPQAIRAKLSYLIVPTLDEEFGEDAAEYLRSLVWEKPLVARVDFNDRKEGEMQVTLFADGDTTSVNQHMLREGLARLEKRRDRVGKARVEELRADEEIGKRSRAYLWQYGDVYDDDEDLDRDFPKMGKKGAAAPANAKAAAAAAPAAKGKK